MLLNVLSVKGVRWALRSFRKNRSRRRDYDARGVVCAVRAPGLLSFSVRLRTFRAYDPARCRFFIGQMIVTDDAPKAPTTGPKRDDSLVFWDVGNRKCSPFVEWERCAVSPSLLPYNSHTRPGAYQCPALSPHFTTPPMVTAHVRLASCVLTSETSSLHNCFFHLCFLFLHITQSGFAFLGRSKREQKHRFE